MVLESCCDDTGQLYEGVHIILRQIWIRQTETRPMKCTEIQAQLHLLLYAVCLGNVSLIQRPRGIERAMLGLWQIDRRERRLSACLCTVAPCAVVTRTSA